MTSDKVLPKSGSLNFIKLQYTIPKITVVVLDQVKAVVESVVAKEKSVALLKPVSEAKLPTPEEIEEAKSAEALRTGNFGAQKVTLQDKLREALQAKVKSVRMVVEHSDEENRPEFNFEEMLS